MKYVWLVLILLAFISGCYMGQSNAPCKCPVADTVKIVEHTVDSFPYPVAVASRPYKPKLIVSNDTSVVADTGCQPSDCYSIRDYVLFSRDSSVKVSSTVHGILMGQVIDAKSTTSVINHYSPVKNRTSWLIGADAGLNYIAPRITMIRNRGYYSMGYDLITKTPVVGFGIKVR